MIFRINWPLDSQVVADLTLNRLTTLSSLIFGQVMLQHLVRQVSVVPASNDMVHVTSLETDHNTPAEHTGPFEKEQLIPI
ncbi:hypothetical protein, partial [Klebsiella pneumoniae]|uniref:hypothetical protein n=2 Tax=Pseudomonadota TaxID=1224 RepID=UPI0013CFF44C